MSETLTLRGVLQGHNGWVTSIAASPVDSNVILSASRDKSIMVWNLTREEGNFGYARRALRGHNHFVSDVQISSDGQYALSSSWDATLRLWEISTGRSTRRFVGHSKDVLSVAFSADHHHIISGSRDRSFKVWSTVGELQSRGSAAEHAHKDWVSCVRFSPNQEQDLTAVSCGWDKLVKVWSVVERKNERTGATHTDVTLRRELAGHSDYLNSVTVSPDGSLCASGGKDGVAILWDLTEGKELHKLPAGDVIHSLVFSPNRYWLCAATTSSIKVWDLESKVVVADLKIKGEGEAELSEKAVPPYATCLAWSPDGSVLYAGATDGKIRVYHVSA